VRNGITRRIYPPWGRKPFTIY